MVDLDQLAGEARRSAEWSRLRIGLQSAFVVASLAANRGPRRRRSRAVRVSRCGAPRAIRRALRWWRREGVDAARLGVAMGALPLVAAPPLPACGVDCTPPGTIVHVELACVAEGVLAGVALALLTERGRRPWRTWMLATAVVALTATLGA